MFVIAIELAEDNGKLINMPIIPLAKKIYNILALVFYEPEDFDNLPIVSRTFLLG